MSQLSSYTGLYPQMIPELNGADPTTDILPALKRAGREFCLRTESWVEWLDPIKITDWQQDYDLTHIYTANIQRVLKVEINGNEQSVRNWGMTEEDETRLRFRSGAVPQDNLTDQLLWCAAIGSSTIGDWTAITDGSVTASLDGSTHEATDLDFSGASDFDDVALILQTGIRTEAEDNGLIVRVIYNSSGTAVRFVMWYPGGTISYLTAGTEGTDISGASYLNGLTGAGTIAPCLRVQVVFRPHRSADDLPDWFLDRYGDTIVAAAMMRLLVQPKKQWTNPALAGEYHTEYARGIARAESEKQRQRQGRPTCVYV